MIWKHRYTTGDKPGFSLIEVVVSVTLFSIIMLSATEIFKMIVDSQRTAIASQNVQESLKYFLEVIGKEIRMAQDSKGDCGIPSGTIFQVSRMSTSSDALAFKNYYGECVRYTIGTEGTSRRFSIDRPYGSGFISPAKIQIDSLHFALNNGATLQPLVTVNLQAHAVDEKIKSSMTIQTSMTSRYYKN